MAQVQQILLTVVRVFVGTILAAFIADITNLSAFAWADWKPVVFAAIAAACVVVLNALNWKDTRYGIGAS
jgi:hypothetical protein